MRHQICYNNESPGVTDQVFVFGDEKRGGNILKLQSVIQEFIAIIGPAYKEVTIFN
jgi:hypothetical protein